MASSRVHLEDEGIMLGRDIKSTFPIFVRFNTHGLYVIEASGCETINDVKELVAQKAGISPGHLQLVFTGHKLSGDVLLQSCGIGSHTTLHAFCSTECSVHNSTTNVRHDGSGDRGDEGAGGAVGRPGVSSDALDELNEHMDGAGCADAQLSTDEEHNTRKVNRCWNGSSVDGVEDGTSVDDSSAFHHREGNRQVTAASTAFHHREGNRQDNNSSRSHGYCRFFVYCKLCDGIIPAKLRLVCKACGNGAFLLHRDPSNWDDISPSTQLTGTCTSEGCLCTTPNFFLRCSRSHAGNTEGTAVLLKHINTNRRRVECMICGDVESHVMIFPCEAGHVVCLGCFKEYCSVCLNERRFTEHERHGYTLPCPARCPNSYIEESHHFLLMGIEKYERFKNFGAEEFVLQHGGILCPAPGCGAGLLPDDESRLVKCEECQYECCKDCRHQYHIGSCNSIQNTVANILPDLGITDEMAERASWELQSLSLIDETTKCCPQCNTKIERSGGCMHMICTRCECDWCWICVKPWTRDCQADHWFGRP